MGAGTIHIETPFRPVDPFYSDRESHGARLDTFVGEELLMLLRWKDVRAAARDPRTFESAYRGRVPIPEEHEIRPFKQIPIETSPPEHARWKDIVLPYSRRPTDPDAKSEFETVLSENLGRILRTKDVDLVSEFALPVQSAALAVLLDCDRSVAEEWQSWGMHALRTNGKTDHAKAARFLEFIDRMLKRGEADPAMGLFSTLHTARYENRPLTSDEKRGICHLALAGGRDTVIHALAGTMAHFAEEPKDLARLRNDPSLIPLATEELFRFLSPLPQIGRVCPSGYTHGPYSVAPGRRAALCWAAANRDPSVFEKPDELLLDRKPNPHVAFGAGVHTCLGAPMARLLVRTLPQNLVERVDRIDIVNAVPRSGPYGTPYLFERLQADVIERVTP